MLIEESAGTISLQIPRHCSGSPIREIASKIAAAYTEGTVRILVLDLSATELIDSNGIGTLVSIAKEAQARKVGLRLKNLNGTISELFNHTGLDRIFTIEREQEVVAATVDFFEPSFDVKLQMDAEAIGDVEVFYLSGVMNHPVGSAFFKQRLLLSLSRSKKVLLDVEELSFIDSMSISALLRMNNLLVMTGGSMAICGAAFIVRDILETLNIGTIIPLYASTAEVLSLWATNDG
jgi:anti-anti-sigma factor